jgi:hypothetical protein
VNRLNRLLSQLSPAERDRLARSLLQASNEISDTRIRSVLRSAASSLANDNQSATQRQLAQLQDVIKRTPEGKAALSRLKQAKAQLDRVKNQVSGVNKQSARQQGRQGALTRNGLHRLGQPQTAQRAGQSSRPGADSHHSGTGRGATSTKAVLKSRTIAPAFNSRGKNPRGPGPRDTSKKRGKFGARRQSSPTGAGINIEVSNRGLPNLRTLRRYHPIIVRYARSARAALGRVPLPPDVATYVRHYFSVISR